MTLISMVSMGGYNTVLYNLCCPLNYGVCLPVHVYLIMQMELWSSWPGQARSATFIKYCMHGGHRSFFFWCRHYRSAMAKRCLMKINGQISQVT